MQERRQTAFTQQEVTEMQKGFIKVLKKIRDSANEMLIRLLKGANIIDLLKYFIERVDEEINVIKKDIEADNNQA